MKDDYFGDLYTKPQLYAQQMWPSRHKPAISFFAFDAWQSFHHHCFVCRKNSTRSVATHSECKVVEPISIQLKPLHSQLCLLNLI